MPYSFPFLFLYYTAQPPPAYTALYYTTSLRFFDNSPQNQGKPLFSTVVGYQLIKVPSGYTLFTPTFTGVTTDLDLTTIEICDSVGNVRSDLINDVGVQKMDAEGVYFDLYGYCPEMGGWNLDFEPVEPNTITFKPGETVCVANATEGDVYFKVAGQVDLVNMNKVGPGYVLWGNATPVTIDLTDVQVVDADGNIMSDLINDVGVQKMDAEGAYLDLYGYCPEMGGWNLDFEPIEPGTVTLEPGEAVCIGNVTEGTVYMKVPCPVK